VAAAAAAAKKRSNNWQSSGIGVAASASAMAESSWRSGSGLSTGGAYGRSEKKKAVAWRGKNPQLVTTYGGRRRRNKRSALGIMVA